MVKAGKFMILVISNIAMMHLKRLSLILLFTVMSAALSEAGKPRIATVDMQGLLADYFRTAQVQEQFNKDYAAIEKRVNQEIERINQLALELRSLGEKLKGGDLNVEDMQKCRQEFQLVDEQRRLLITEKTQSEEDAKRDVDNRKQASTQALMREIRAKVARIAQEDGYDYVFDQSGKNTNQVSFFLYLKDTTDITATVLKELNQFAPNSPDE